ncbi:MAG TPA: hypothetical protein VJK30_04295 [Coxiellaceae bacterium]|nr:MAG: hypothetical protein A3E81_07690 [Gammaproteobacteria bacterium RIFCSPHIGHO2_12_FULL_36_30]HLB56530.1 hypothetical protein [Coxiellaceae bacterium]
MRYPFRVFANQNLGIQYDNTAFTGEWLNSNGIGQSPVLPNINLATGNVIVQSTLVKTQEQIGNWEFGFVYNAQNPTPWSMNIPTIIPSNDSQLIFSEKDGSQVTYTFDATQDAYVAPSGSQSKSLITKQSDNSFVQVDPKTGSRTFYEANGNIACVYDARGFLMRYYYDPQGNLQTITSAAGIYTIKKTATDTSLIFVQTGTTNSVLLGTWTFDIQNRLNSAVIPGTTDYAINYNYSGTTNKLTSITQTDGTTINLTYTTDVPAKIQTVQQGSGGPNYTFAYNTNNATITDALGFVTTATLNAQNNIETFSQQNGDATADLTTLTTQCNYHVNGDIKNIIKPNTAKTQFECNKQGLITQKIKPNGQTIQYDYDPITFARIIKRELISGSGDTAVWATTRYVYHNNVRSNDDLSFRDYAFKISPQGCVTQYQHDANGILKSEKIYLQNTYNVNNLTPTTPLTYSDMGTWIATQPSNIISLTAFSENSRGQRTSIRKFSNINSDGSGNEDAFASHDQMTNHTIWGAAQTHTEKMAVVSGANVNAVTQDAFDNLHRLTSHQNANNETRSVVYNDANKNAVITEQNGRTETTVWNDAGQIQTITTAITASAVTRTKSNAYDVAGNVSAITGIDGQITYQLCDSLNRERFVITPAGRVIEYFYDDINRYRCETHYYNTVPISTLTTLPPTFAWIATNLTPNTEKDVSTYSVYDLSNRLQFEVNGRGAVTQHVYDLKNREYLNITYAAKISATEMIAITSGTFSRTPSTSDRVLATFYDNDNNIIATQDGDNYVTQYQRNPAGTAVLCTRFATPAEQNLTGTIVYPATSKDDFSQYFYSDARGQRTLTVDGVTNANYVVQNYVVQNSFYPNGKPQTETKFANQSSVVPSVNGNPTQLIPTANTEDQITTNVYDLLNRLVQQHLPQQRLKSWQFDGMGNLILECVGDDPASNTTVATHGHAKQFDDWGQLTQEAPPLVYAKILSIQNNSALTPTEQQAQIAAVWANQALQYLYNNAGLHTAKIDIVPDNATAASPITFFYYDADKRLVLTVGAEGQTTQITPHPVFNKPEEQTRYATATNTTTLTGGFINPAITALITPDINNDQTEKNKYDGAGAECEHIDAEGYVTKTNTNTFGQCDKKELPIDNTTPSLTINYQFDFRGNETQETKTAGTESIATLKEYKNLHGLCTSITDGNNNTTTLTHEPRGVLSTSTDANGNTTAFSNDAFKREILCTLPMGQSVQSVFTQATRKVTNQYLDSANNVLASTAQINDGFGNVIISQDAEGNTTQAFFNAENQCEIKLDPNDNQYKKEHDLRGLLIEESFRQSNPLLYNTKTKRDYTISRKLRHKIQDATHLNLKTKHDTNALGQRYKTTTPSGYIRKTLFNKRSLATAHQKILNDATSVVTAQSYSGLKTANTLNTFTTNLTHTYQEQLITDGFGREFQRIVDPVSASNPDALALTHEKQLDNTNRLIASVDPKGQTTYLVRDAVGNIRFEINAKGGVIEHQYNAANKLVFTAHYITAVASTSLSVGMTIAAVQALLDQTGFKTDFDQHTYYFYDDLFNERFSVNRAGVIVESRYNLNKEKIASIRYYASIDNDPTTLTTSLLETKCKDIRQTNLDKASYRVLDPAGQEVFIINADGSVIQKCYHSTLHIVNHEIKYANVITNPEAAASLSIADITALLTPSDNDRHTYWIVDGLDRLQFYVKPNGAVTSYEYDGNTNNRVQITEFSAAVTLPATNYSALQTTLNNLVPNAAVDNIEKRIYDNAEREITRTNGAGNSESFGYDGASRRSSHTTLSGNKWTYDYDGASRLWHEYSPATTIYSASIDPANVTAIEITPAQNTVVEKEINYDANSNAISIASGVSLSDQHIVNFAYNALNLKNQDTWNNISVDDPTQTTSLTVRPEKIMPTINKTVVHGAHGKKLVETNEAGNSVFYAYDAQGQLKYKIDEAGYVSEFQRNSFGECEHLIVYATQLTINLSQYNTTGLTPDIIAANLTKDPTSDRSFNSTFDQNGKIIQVTRDPVVCYIPDPNQNVPTVAIQTPTKNNAYNTFDETISESIVVDETNNIVRTKFIWRDNNGNEIATVDANGKAIVKTFDVRSREIETYTYANSLTPTQLATISTSTTFAELQTILTSIADTTRDHDVLTPRDILGNITGVIHVGILTQQIVSGQQAFENNPDGPQNIGVTFTYTRDNKVKTKTYPIKTPAYPNGLVESFYYDERRYLIARAFVPRTQTIGTTSTVIQPIIYYHVSAHGDRVETYQPASGCVVVTDPTSEVVPLPVSTSAQDFYHRFMKDPRGNLLIKQDAENNLKQMTHTLTGKVARDYHPTTNGTATTVASGTLITHIDEHRKKYDVRDELTLNGTYRDNNLESAIAYQQNAFKEIKAEGPGDGTFPVQHKHDQAGREYSTFQTSNTTAQAVGPIGELTGFNAEGDKTVKIQSQTQDLSTTSCAQLSTVMANRDDVVNYEFTETLRDLDGKPCGFVEPGFPSSAMQASSAKKYVGDETTVRPVHKITFNNFAKKSSITTPNGEVTAFTHTKLNKLETQTDPAIPVTSTSNVTTNVAALTTLGYDESGNKIGVQDANLNTELFLRNEAGQVLTHSAGDGTPYYTKTPNVFGQDFQVMSASGNIWKKTFTSKGEVITVTQPSGDTWTYQRNENGFVNLITPPENSVMGATAYAQGVYGDMSGHFLPMGEQHLYSHDRHHGILSHTAINIDGSTAYTMSLVRDFWGNVTNKTDASNSTYLYSYFPSGSLYQEKGVTVNHGNMLTFDAATNTFSQTPVATPLKNKTYAWTTSLRLSTITDNNTAMPQTLVQIFDINRNITSITETNGNGNTIRATVMTYNARQWLATLNDTGISIINSFDPVGNRRNINATYQPASGNPIIHNAWYTQDAANRVLINDGQLNNGVIQTVPYTSAWGYIQLTQNSTSTIVNTSNEFSYENGLRATQALYIPGSMGTLSDGNPLSAAFGYDVNDRVASVTPAPYGSSGSRRRQRALKVFPRFDISDTSSLIAPFAVSVDPVNSSIVQWDPSTIPNGTQPDSVTASAIPNNDGAFVAGQYHTKEPRIDKAFVEFNFSDTSASILPIPRGVIFDSIARNDGRGLTAVVWWWTQVPGETQNNTTAIMLNNDQSINGQVQINFRQTDGDATWGRIAPSTNYIATIIINVNGQIYQGAVPIPAWPGSSALYYYPENISYTADGLFLSSFINLNNSTQYILRQMTYDQNGGVPNYIYFNLDGSAGNATYATQAAPFNVDGLPTASGTAWSSVTDNLTYTFQLLDTTVIQSVTGTRTDSAGTSTAVSCPRYYDANSGLNSTTGVFNPFNPNDTNQYSLYFYNSLLSGRILSEYRVLSGAIVSPTFYFQDGRGNILAEYGEIGNSQNQTAMALSLTADPVHALNVSNLQSASTTVQDGDSWSSISYRLFRDAAYQAILKAYSGVQLASGQRVDAMQTINAYNKARDFSAFEKLIQVVYNAMYPALKTPEPPPPKPHHESFWDELIGIIVSVVVMICAPEIGGIIFGVAAASLTVGETVVAFAIAGALADAATQGIAVAFDDQHGFSIKEMVENAITSGATAGLAKELGVAKLLSNGKYFAAFAETATVGVTVQLYEMSIGLRSKLDLKLIVEQAVAQVLSGKIHNELPQHTSNFIESGLDEVGNTAVNAAFGAPINVNSLAELAANYTGDTIGDPTADYLGNKIKSDSSPNMGASTSPTNFSNQIQGAQSGLRNISPDSAANDSMFNLYNAYENGLSDSVNNIAETNYLAASSAIQTDVEVHHAQRIQQRQTQKVARPAWENDLSKVLYDNQNSWWGRSAINFFAATASPMFAHAVSQHNALNPLNAMEEADTGYDPVTGQPVSLKQAYMDAAISVTTFVGGGEIGDLANGVADITDNLMAGIPSIGRNIASMFGRGGVSNSIVDEFDDAVDIDNSRTIAAAHVREARNILSDAGVNATWRNRILHSFDLETFRVEHVMEPRQIYRAFDDFDAKMLGRYASESLLENQTGRITDLALPSNSATRLATVEIPDGSTIFTGRVASQFGLRGGAQQTFLTGTLDQYTFQEIMMPREIYEPRGMTNAY